MTGKQLRAVRIAMDRAIESGDLQTAEDLGALLAPYYDRVAAIRDERPSLAYQRWGVEA